jgi:hypothetical protein
LGRALRDIDDDLAAGGAIPDRLVGIGDSRQGEVPGIEDRDHLAGLGQAAGRPEDFPVMGSALAGEQRQQGENAGIAGATEGQRGEGVGAPTKGTDDMAVAADGDEGGVGGGTADSAVDDVEAFATDEAPDMVRSGLGAVVNSAR